MDIEVEKLELMKLLEATNDSAIIASIKKNFNASKKDFWEELTEEQKLDIEEGEKQIERGEYVDFDEFIQKYLG
jgi:predicted transcriptional regulator